MMTTEATSTTSPSWEVASSKRSRRKGESVPLATRAHTNNTVDLRIHLEKQRAARHQADAKTEAAVTAVSASGAKKASKGAKKKKRAPLPSFLPDYISPTPAVQTKSRMSKQMLEDLAPEAAAPIEAETSPQGADLMLKKVASQQRRAAMHSMLGPQAPVLEWLPTETIEPGASKDKAVESEAITHTWVDNATAEESATVEPATEAEGMSFEAIKHSFLGFRRPRVVTVESDGLITTRTASGRVTNRWPVDSIVSVRMFADRAASSSFSFGLRVATSPVSSLLGMLFGCFAGVQELRFSVDSALARDEIVQRLTSLIVERA